MRQKSLRKTSFLKITTNIGNFLKLHIHEYFYFYVLTHAFHHLIHENREGERAQNFCLFQ